LDILSSIKYGRTIIYKYRHDLEYMEDADKIMEMPKQCRENHHWFEKGPKGDNYECYGVNDIEEMMNLL